MIKIGWTEKWTLRFAVVALLFLALSGFEGMLMRTQLYDQEALHGMEAALNTLRPGVGTPTTEELYYSMLTAHPIVGVYGFIYMAVFGAFYFLVPHLLDRPIRHKKLVVTNFWLQIAGVMICWGAGFFGLFNSLYTLYWPLPVSYDRTPMWGSIFFMVGAALVMVNILIFAFNIFKTVLSKSDDRPYSFLQFLRSAFGIPRLLKLFGKEDKNAPNLDYNGLPVFIVAVGRGSIDTVINAIVLLTAGALILVYGLFALFGSPLNPGSVDALLYKNWYWWGLDMVADGNALIYTAGVWYLLIPLLQHHCKSGLEQGREPLEILDAFFDLHPEISDRDEMTDFMFRVIQYVERQIVLFDSVEDAAFPDHVTEPGPLAGVAPADLQDLVDGGEVGGDRADLDVQRLGDLLVAHPPGHQLGHLEAAQGEGLGPSAGRAVLGGAGGVQLVEHAARAAVLRFRAQLLEHLVDATQLRDGLVGAAQLREPPRQLSPEPRGVE